MHTKLTLRLDARLIRDAKRYAQRSGKSLSEMVADVFRRMAPSEQPASEEPRSPAVRSLLGALSGHELSRDQHRQYLENKHR